MREMAHAGNWREPFGQDLVIAVENRVKRLFDDIEPLLA
jgi:hypothetical protein